MTQFAHLSDPHLTPLEGVRLRSLIGKRALGYLSWQRRRKHRHLPTLLERVTADVRDYAPEHIALTGDLTQIGLPVEHAIARDWLGELGAPAQVSLAPGNHDFYGRDSARALYHAWRDYLDGPDAWPMRRDVGEVAFIGLCSGVPSGAAFATGTLGERQLERLDTLLAGLRGYYRVLLVHHSPHRRTHVWRKRLTDASALRAVLVRHGVELVLHGHSHRASLDYIDGPGIRIPVLGAPSASLRSGVEEYRAGYHRIAVTRHAHTWQTRIVTRQCVGTQVVTTAEHGFNSPSR